MGIVDRLKKEQEEDNLSWLDANSAAIKWLDELYRVEFIKEFKKVHLRGKSPEWYSQASKDDLLTILHEQHRLLSSLEFLFKDVGTNATIVDLYNAQEGAKHWKTIKQFLKDNPHMQEQWETFLMTLRLSQD